MLAYDHIDQGELQGVTTAMQLPTVASNLVKFKALPGNVGNVYIGDRNVTVPKGNTNTTAGLVLAPGDDSGWLPISNLNRLWMVCDTVNDELTYLILR